MKHNYTDKIIGFQTQPKKDAEGNKLPVLIQQLNVRPIYRKSQDIEAWRNAIRAAESLNPRRTELYDLYADIMLDGHLISVIEKRIMALTNIEWQFLDADGKEVDWVNKWIDTPAFEELVSEIIKSKLWGYTMIEFDFSQNNQDDDQLFSLYTIPRKHIRPETGFITFEQTGTDGINIRQGIYSNTVLEAGKEKDLGLLMVVAQYVIYKRGNFGDWAQFAEVFGMPLIDAVWDGYDERQRITLLKALDEMGSGGQLVRPAGTELNFVQGGSNNPNGDLYHNLIKACNSEISKAILGQTETTESSTSSGYAQSETHADTENDINKSDRNFVRRILNRRVTKILKANGIDTQDGSFSIKNDSERPLTKTEQIEIDLKLKNEAKIPIADDYFYATYGIEKPQDYDEQKQEMKQAQAMPPFGGFNMRYPSIKSKLTKKGLWKTLTDFFHQALKP